MERGRLGSELRESVALLRAETWLFAGVGLAWVTYGAWVVATGLLIQEIGGGLADAVFTTIDGVTVSLFSVIAAGVWLVVPALVAVVFINRRLRNSYGNLTDAYRLDHPSLLVAVPGTVLAGCLLLSVALGGHVLLTVVALIATVHLVVRTVAYGHRVYTLSAPPALSLLLFVSGLSLGTGWLVAATTAPAWLSTWTTQAGAGTVVETGLRVAPIPLTQVVTATIAVPGGLATGYLLAQLAAGAIVRARAPLSNPQRRPDQRFPIMPPVGVPQRDAQTSVVASKDRREGRDQPAESAANENTDRDSADPQPEHTGTRVFSPEEVAQSEPPSHESTHSDAAGDAEPLSDETRDSTVPAESNAATESEPPAEDGTTNAAANTETPIEDNESSQSEADDEWVDDTAVFSPGSRDAAPSYCGACGESLSPGDTTCPSCGESVER